MAAAVAFGEDTGGRRGRASLAVSALQPDFGSFMFRRPSPCLVMHVRAQNSTCHELLESRVLYVRTTWEIPHRIRSASGTAVGGSIFWDDLQVYYGGTESANKTNSLFSANGPRGSGAWAG